MLNLSFPIMFIKWIAHIQVPQKFDNMNNLTTLLKQIYI